MPQNLVKTPHGYVYRKSIPTAVRHIIQQSEFKRSLGRDFKLAKIECAKLEVHVTQLIEDAKRQLAVEDSLDKFLKQSPATRLKPISAGQPGLASQVAALYLNGLNVDLELRRTRARDSEEYDELSENIGKILPQVNKALATGDVRDFCPVVAQLIIGRGYALNATDEQLQTLTYDVVKHIQTGYKILAERQAGNLVSPPFPADPLPASWEQPSAQIKKKLAAPKIPKLSAVLPLIADHLASTGKKNTSTKLGFWEKFTAFCGDKALQEANVGDVYGFLESRLKAKTGAWAPGTIVKAKSLLKTGFALAQVKGMCDKNPVLELAVSPSISAREEKKRKKSRFPFSITQLNQIFASSWYEKDSKNFRGKMGWDLGARYFVPLICLYHGLRVTEAVQLYKTDIVPGAVPMLKIAVEDDGVAGKSEVKRTLKNASTERCVPLHPELVKLGLVEYATKQANWKETKLLFPSATPDDDSADPVLGRAYSQSFLRFLKQKLEFEAGFCNHSFRHTLEDAIRSAQLNKVWPAGVGQAYSGRHLPRDADRGIVREEGVMTQPFLLRSGC